MIDPQYFEEPRAMHNRLIAWLYVHHFLELHHGKLRLTDEAAVYAMLAIAAIGLGFGA